MVIELKPCPFCGGRARMLHLGPAQCVSCGIKGPECKVPVRLDKYEEYAAMRWNSRANDEKEGQD